MVVQARRRGPLNRCRVKPQIHLRPGPTLTWRRWLVPEHVLVVDTGLLGLLLASCENFEDRLRAHRYPTVVRALSPCRYASMTLTSGDVPINRTQEMEWTDGWPHERPPLLANSRALRYFQTELATSYSVRERSSKRSNRVKKKRRGGEYLFVCVESACRPSHRQLESLWIVLSRKLWTRANGSGPQKMNHRCLGLRHHLRTHFGG